MNLEPLIWTDVAATGVSSGEQYRIVDGIPVLVPPSDDAHKTHQADFYDDEDPEYEITRPHGTPAFFAWLLGEKYRRSIASMGELRGRTVLTVCGGSGMDAEFLARSGARVIASDISLGAAMRTRERAQRFNIDLLPIVADVEHLPFADQSVDFVYVHDGLHHLENPTIGLREMARVARIGVSINEPYEAAITQMAVRFRLAEVIEDAGNKVERLRADQVAALLYESGLTRVHANRYAMFYRHRPGPFMRLLSGPLTLPLAQRGLNMTNRVVGRFGNKLTVQALRPDVE